MHTLSDRLDALGGRVLAIQDETDRAAAMAHIGAVLTLHGATTLRELLDRPDAVAAEVTGRLEDDIEIGLVFGFEVVAVEEAGPSASRVDSAVDWPALENATALLESGLARCPTAGDMALPNLDLAPHDPRAYQVNLVRYGEDLNDLANLVHRANIHAGWWENVETGEPRPRNVFEMLALAHSEISEAVEGHRKGLMDDHLPHRPSIEVELADLFIRILDTAAALRLDLGGAVAEKAVYNMNRVDHSREARRAIGGKKA